MSTDSKYSKQQEQALIHWYQNLITVMTMDWDEWSSRTKAEHWAEVRFGTNSVPHITAEYCNYCHEHAACTECPLYEDGTDCCSEWEDVRAAIIYNPDREKAIEAIEALIYRIQEAH